MLGLECVRELNYSDQQTPWGVLGSEYSGRYFNTDDAMEIRERDSKSSSRNIEA
jgi:hypothetical protein